MAKLEDVGRILSANSRNASGNRKEQLIAVIDG